MSFKVGDEVVCVKKDNWKFLNGDSSDHLKNPKYNDDCIVAEAGSMGGYYYIVLSGYNGYYCASNFRKKQNHTFKNKTTANLASRIREEKGIERILIKETA